MTHEGRVRIAADRSRSAFFNLALDQAEGDEAARGGATEIESLLLQEKSLREAADMIASRVEIMRARERPGAEAPA
jgi:hypothetical protein